MSCRSGRSTSEPNHPGPLDYKQHNERMSRPLAVVKSLDHLVLTCASIPATVNWYTRHLGMKAETFGTSSDPAIQRHALRFGTQKINLHQRGKEFEPKALTALPGTVDVCFLVGDDSDLEILIQGFQKGGVHVLEGAKVVPRTGARGNLRSIYVRDPDGNLVE